MPLNRNQCAVDVIPLLVDIFKLVVHVLFLAKVLRNGNAADHFLHIGIDAS